MLRNLVRGPVRASMTSPVSVVHDESKRRFVGSYPGMYGTSYLEYRFINPQLVDFFRTVTEPELRG